VDSGSCHQSILLSIKEDAEEVLLWIRAAKCRLACFRCLLLFSLRREVGFCVASLYVKLDFALRDAIFMAVSQIGRRPFISFSKRKVVGGW